MGRIAHVVGGIPVVNADIHVIIVVLLQFSLGKVCCRIAEAHHSNHE